MGVMAKPAKVYRCLESNSLPECIWEPARFEGIEYAFLSTSGNQDRATQSSASVALEISSEIGADVSWLSQYPSEEEVLFPPFMCLKGSSSSRACGSLHIIEASVETRLSPTRLDEELDSTFNILTGKSKPKQKRRSVPDFDGTLAESVDIGMFASSPHEDSESPSRNAANDEGGGNLREDSSSPRENGGYPTEHRKQELQVGSNPRADSRSPRQQRQQELQVEFECVSGLPKPSSNRFLSRISGKDTSSYLRVTCQIREKPACCVEVSAPYTGQKVNFQEDAVRKLELYESGHNLDFVLQDSSKGDKAPIGKATLTKEQLQGGSFEGNLALHDTAKGVKATMRIVAHLTH